MRKFFCIAILFTALFALTACDNGSITGYALALGYEADDAPAAYEWPTDTTEDLPAEEPTDYYYYYYEYIEEVYEDPPEDYVPRRLIALTFDDGPSSHTLALLEAFEERGVRATFFLLGRYVTNRPQIALQTYEAGHEIGNHSYNHRDFTRLDASAIRRQINDTNSAIYNATGFTPTLLRTPYGSHNRTVIGIATEMNMPLVLWNVDPRDWFYRDAQIIYENIVNHAADGAIILLHDIREATVLGTIKAIDTLLELGYEFVTVSEMFAYREVQMEGGNIYHRGPVSIPEIDDGSDETEESEHPEENGELNERTEYQS